MPCRGSATTTAQQPAPGALQQLLRATSSSFPTFPTSKLLCQRGVCFSWRSAPSQLRSPALAVPTLQLFGYTNEPFLGKNGSFMRLKERDCDKGASPGLGYVLLARSLCKFKQQQQQNRLYSCSSKRTSGTLFCQPKPRVPMGSVGFGQRNIPRHAGVCFTSPSDQNVPLPAVTSLQHPRGQGWGTASCRSASLAFSWGNPHFLPQSSPGRNNKAVMHQAELARVETGLGN